MSKHSSHGAKWQALRKAVLERDSYQCQHCGAPATDADHIIPKSKGGTDSMDNLLASCKRCNSRRRDTMLVRSSFFNPRWFPEGMTR